MLFGVLGGMILGLLGFVLLVVAIEELKIKTFNKRYKIISRTKTDLVLKKGRIFFFRKFRYKWNEKRFHWISAKGTQPNADMLERAIKEKKIKDFGKASADEAWGGDKK